MTADPHTAAVLAAAYAVVEAQADDTGKRDLVAAIENLEKVLGDGREAEIRVKDWSGGLFPVKDFEIGP